MQVNERNGSQHVELQMLEQSPEVELLIVDNEVSHMNSVVGLGLRKEDESKRSHAG